jgi:hypothetical protein
LDDKKVHPFKPSITKSKARNISVVQGLPFILAIYVKVSDVSHNIIFISIIVRQQTEETHH